MFETSTDSKLGKLINLDKLWVATIKTIQIIDVCLGQTCDDKHPSTHSYNLTVKEI